MFSEEEDKPIVPDSKKIDICAPMPDDENKKFWGDYHYALAMKKELEKHGYQVDVRPYQRWYESTDSAVTIALRGNRPYYPKEEIVQKNIMWNISHPADIPQGEYERFDLVYFASEKLCRKWENELKTKCDVLLQCADPDVMKSVEIKGSMVNVYIKENYSMNKEAVKSVYSDGEDIVSSCQGVVKKIITRSGTPLVACGDEVQEGQVLVSGRVAVTDDSGTELYQVDVCPDADILVHTVIAYDDILEREYGYRQYTKRRYSSLIIENNSGLIKLTKPHRRIEQYDIITQKYPLIVAGGIDTGIVIGVENRKEYKVMNDRYNDVQLEDILNERLQMYISHMEQKGVQIMDCRVNIDTTDDRGSCTGELEVLLPVTN